jgi:polysaccharide biosynthesis PFTS motif protein
LTIITLYFYSTNIEPLKYNGNPAYGYSSMSWSHYLVWDIYQANFIRKIVNSKKIDIVGPIWFSDVTSTIRPINSKKIVTIFDVQPVRDSFYKSLGIDFDYYTVKNVSQYILDIYDVLKKTDCVVILKRKRDIGKLSHIAYRNLIKELSNSERFIIEDSNISARLLIDKSNLVISMPYTSTALIAKELNKPSIYYDPRGILMRDASASHSIPIVSSKQKLHKWIINNI